MGSSEPQLISKVSGSYPQIFTEHLLIASVLLMRLFHLLHSSPSSPNTELLSTDLTPSDNSTAVTFGFLRKPFNISHTGAHRGQFVVNLITCQERG